MSPQRYFSSSARKTGERVLCGIVTAAILPLGLASCSQTLPAAADEVASGTQLRAAPDMNMFTADASQVYDVQSIEISSPAPMRELAAEGITSSGTLTLGDRVISEASFQVSLASGEDISFTLTEPLVLRRSSGADAPLYAIGTITVPGAEWHGARVKVTSDFSEKDQAILEVEIPLPESLLTADSQESSATVISARIKLTTE